MLPFSFLHNSCPSFHNFSCFCPYVLFFSPLPHITNIPLSSTLLLSIHSHSSPCTPSTRCVQVLTEAEFEQFEQRGLAKAETVMKDSFHCQTADCPGWCVYEDDVNDFPCPICNKTNCLLCKAIHEGMNCKEYQDDINRKAANDAAARATKEFLEVCT